MLRAAIRCALAVSLCVCAAAHALGDSVVFVLRKDAKSMTLEKQVVPDGQTRVWKLGQDGFIDVIAPTGVGGSGGIVQAAAQPVVEATSKDGRLTLTTVTGGGQRYQRSTASAEELAGLDVRVSARAGDGATFCGYIRRNQTAQADAIGPVEDIFGGRIPLAPGDCAISTNTFAARNPAAVPLEGVAPIRMVNGHHLTSARSGEISGDMVIDLAAGTTILLRSALPPGTKIEESVMTQHSPKGIERLAAEVGGATGAVAPSGVAVIPDLIVGDIHFKDAGVLVMDDLPPVGDGKVIGILGIDLLARARSVTFGAQGTPNPTLTLGGPAPAAPEATVPLSLIGDRAYTSARVNGADICMIVDSGSPITVLDAPAAKAAAIAESKGEEKVRGLGASRSPLSVGAAKTLTLGAIELKDVPVRAGSLPIFATLRAGKPVGILGNDVLSRFSTVRLDFDRAELILVR